MSRELHVALKGLNDTSDSKAAGDKRNVAAQVLRHWVSSKMILHTGKDILEVLAKEMPVSTNESTLNWSQRLNDQNHGQNPRIVAIQWSNGTKEVLGIRIDSVENESRYPGYFVSALPFLLARDGTNVSIYFLEDSRYKFLGANAYTFQGLVKQNKPGEFPDILLTAGPVGSGGYVYWIQLHPDVNQGWKLSWEYSCPYVSNIDYRPEANTLIVEYHPDRFDPEIRHATNILTNGK